jgi:L-threonylcarbamoyladenylate synthase
VRIIGVDPRREDVPLVAVHVLRRGGLVALPTDTYYALGAAVADEQAVARVFAAKRRPPVEPLPVLVADRAQWQRLVAEIPDVALRLADRFWPGALTIICRRAAGLPAALTGGGDTIGARQPDAPLAIGLCATLEMGITGTSANTHGMPAPVSAAQVALDLGEAVDVVLDGGRCPIARPSTVIDVTRTPPLIVRRGAIDADALRRVIGDVAVPEVGAAG